MKIQSILAALVIAQSMAAVSPALAQASATQDVSVPSLQQLKHPSADDKQVIKAVRRRLSRTSGLNPSNISVLAHNGIVFLTGSAPTQNEIDLAISSASRVPNVNSVISKLTIREPA
ncbi:BON domain-containing protein [Paraburkholderia sediminicola]|uniref:BON domain-containing protein n=1 Tax=Paraburkholderia metrosideri TaxID=580937 RepID=A0ABW9DVR7_9BURK